MNILAVCAHGLGSSFLMEMNIKKALKALDIDADVGHSDFSLTSNNDADIFVMAQDIADSSGLDKNKTITIKNLVDQNEYKEKLAAFLADKGE